jgi:hypothetical protein
MRYRVLFFVLLLTMAVGPLGEAMGLGAWPLALVVAVNLVVAAAGITTRPGQRALIVLVAVVAAVLRVMSEELLPPWLVMTGGVLWLAVAATAMAAAVRFGLRATRVDAEHVAAALSAYLLAGVLFAVAYVVLDYRWPGSVVELAAGPAGPLTLKTAMYYSFVTLATLGYGDVVPRGVARGVAVVEAVAAQLYLTVTVARLVGLYTMSARTPPAGGEDGP